MGVMRQPGLHLRIRPETGPGRWSVGLFLLSITSFVVFFALVASGQTGGETLADNWLLAGTMAAAAGSALLGGIAGVIAILRDRERALAVILAIAFGAVNAFFFIGEVVAPH